MHPSNIAAMLTVEQATDLRERLTAAMGIDRPAPTPAPTPVGEEEIARWISGEDLGPTSGQTRSEARSAAARVIAGLRARGVIA